jgi:tRNA dimethylallyltransferase
MAARRPLVVIVGPTASGKTALAVEIAKRFGGEIISADSRAVYRGMDIGTAKPTSTERGRVPHWGVDLVDPDERFTVADFQLYATKAIADIRSRGKLPIMVGGSGLYVDSIILGYQFGPGADDQLRDSLTKLSVQELQHHIKRQGIAMPNNTQNKRYLIRAIEQGGVNKKRQKSNFNNIIVVGITTTKEKLQKRIQLRVDEMFARGIERETKRLMKLYDAKSEPMKSNIYPIVGRLLSREISRDEAKALIATSDWHLAKKQLTWFRRHSHIKWLPREQIESYLEQIISQKP